MKKDSATWTDRWLGGYAVGWLVSYSMIEEVKGSYLNYDFSFHLVDLIDLTVLEGVSKYSGTVPITKYIPAFLIGRFFPHV